MLNIQTDTRGNLMAHDKSYLHPFIEANNKIKDIFKTLKVLVRDNPVQVERLDSLDRFMDIKLKIIHTNIGIIESGGKQI